MKTVAIIGAHPRTRDQFDFARTDCEIWVFNEALSAPWCKRATAVFQMHSPTIWRNPANRNDPNHYAWLQSGDTPTIYMQEQYPDVPRSERYPLDALLWDLLGAEKPVSEMTPEERANMGACFTSTLAYMIALAIYQGFTRIEIYGCELETGTEYQFQRESFAYWAGLARGRGIIVDDRSNILRDPLYGYEGGAAIEYAAFEQRIAEIDPLCADLKAQYDICHAETVTEFTRYSRTGQAPDKLMDAIRALLDLGIKFGTLDGQRAENARYKEKADMMRATSGEFIFSRQEFDSALQGILEAHKKAVTQSNVSGGKCEVAFEEARAAGKDGFLRRNCVIKLSAAFEVNLKETIDAAFYAGTMQENAMFLRTLDKKVQAAGGAKSEAVMLERMREVAV